MNLISRADLKIKHDQGDDFKLVMTLNEQSFKMAHISGSFNITSMEQAQGLVSPNDEIVVYCHDENCPASKAAYQMLVSHGFTSVRRYAGGMRDWQDAGYPVEKDASLEQRTVETTLLSQTITSKDHIQGSAGAPITLVVYGDYECPYTRRTMIHVNALQRRLGDKLCFVYRHFPAPAEIHPHARMAAEAALAANAQDKFWEMHDHLFKHQRALQDRVSGSLQGGHIGLPNLFGFFALYPQQVGESSTLTLRNPKEPTISVDAGIVVTTPVMRRH